jgi:hypothetical protein
MIIVVVKVVVSLVPKRSVFFETEKVASETYKKFTSRLETISKESAKDIEARMKDI